MAKFAINASGAMLLPSLVQVSESISGSVVPLAMFMLVLDTHDLEWLLECSGVGLGNIHL